LKPYTQWIDDGNFWIRGAYDPVTDKEAPVGPLKLIDHQRRILSHCLTPYQENGVWKLPYTTVIYSCPKKSGKTTIGASVGAWFSSESVSNTESFCLAGDYEHAMGRMFDDLLFDATHGREDFPNGKTAQKPNRDLLVYPDGKTIQAIAQEYKTASGSRHALTLWDELWTYTSEASNRLWVEMTPIKIPGVPVSLRFVSTYAGFEGQSELLWALYDQIVLHGEPVPELIDIQHASGEPTCWRNGRMFAYWDSAHRMPWQTEDYYLEQLASGMKPNEYARLHENRWTTGSEPFMPISWWDKAAVLPGSLEYDVKNPRRQLPVIIGCDASTKHDSTAIVGIQYDYAEDMLYLAFHKIWKPSPTEPMDFEHTLERYILERHNEGFQIAAIVYDPTQLHRSMTRLAVTIQGVTEFPQTLRNMTGASETLYSLFKNKKLLVYADADLRDHMKYAMAEEKGKGFRIVKPPRASSHHTDAAIALAMAAFYAYKTHGYDVSKPIRIEIPFSDASEYREKSPQDLHEEENLPPQLRSGGLTEEEFDAEWKKHVKREGTNA